MTRVAWCLTNIFTKPETLFFSWYELYLRYDMKIIALYTDIRNQSTIWYESSDHETIFAAPPTHPPL